MNVPNSTYRLQVNHETDFNKISDILDYIHKLGINWIYASPIFKSKKGSMHGYDVVDPQQINPELGNYEDLSKLAEKLGELNMGWLQDIVPNHMSYNHENQMLTDLLENGPNSRYYNFFDIEWNHPHASVGQRVMAPFLGKYYQDCLEQGELKLQYEIEGFSINYWDTKLPIRMESYVDILSFRLDQLRNNLGRNNPDVIKYLGILYTLKSLPEADHLDERYDQIKFLKGLLWELYSGNEDIKVFINESLKIYNGEPGNPESFNQLDSLHGDQYFRLCFWKVATEEINYRRFFNINELISLRMENEETFSRTHTLIFKLIREGIIDGLRIDHIDGLYDPLKYLRMLRIRGKKSYIVVEKILELDEKLPESWPVEGTTGYEFINFTTLMFCKKENENLFNSIYQKFIKTNYKFQDVVHTKKNLIIKGRMAGEVERLAFIVESISSRDRYGIDITMHALKQALDEILTYFPVYRTYINNDDFSEQDKKFINEVIETATRKNPRLVNEIKYIGNLLLMKYGEHFSDEQKEQTIDFIMRFQQLTGPLMAKGFEDTALYVYNRLISLNEVGGNPGSFGISVGKFHTFNSARAEKWKYSLNASSTHDTKRSEDVRARINVLSEIPSEWDDKIKLWNKLNKNHKTIVGDREMPDRNDEYFLYQTLIGSGAFDTENIEDYKKRIKDYVIKAVREAKIYTAWIKPDDEYENAYLNFVDKILIPGEKNRFFADLSEFTSKVAYYGRFNSLSQLLLKITSPGIPDFYQGTELWDLSLVDPDNRRPVDYSIRREYLNEVRDVVNPVEYIPQLLNDPSNGKIKLFLMYQALKCRNTYTDYFLEGDYFPVEIEGERKENIAAFARSYKDKIFITAVPRFTTELCSTDDLPLGDKIWNDTSIIIPETINSISNEITCVEIKAGDKIKAADIFKIFPAALLNCSK